MIATTDRSPLVRRRVLVATAAVGMGLLLAPPAAYAQQSGCWPTQDLLMPGIGSSTADFGAILDQDSVALLVPDPDGDPRRDSVLFTRSIVTTPDAVTLGRATLLGRAAGYSLAEHDGTLAYQRQVDGRLVLRAPDGTEILPPWGASPTLVASGPAAMTGDWLADRSGTLYDLRSGVPLSLLDMVPGLPSPPDASVADVALTDGAVAWTVRSEDSATTPPAASVGYVASLGPEGVLGDVHVLGETWQLVGFVGEHLVWSTVTPAPDPEGHSDGDQLLTLRSVPAAAPTAPAVEHSLEVSGHAHPTVINAGDAVVVPNMDVLFGEAGTWLDPSDLTTVVWSGYSGHVSTHDNPGLRIAGSIGLQFNGSHSWLVDFRCRNIVADQTPAEPPALPADVSVGNPFVRDVQWLADLGIARGYADGTFRPAAPVNRDAMAAFLYRLAGEPAFSAPPEPRFRDVPTTHPFYREIEWLAETKVSTGFPTPEGSFYRPAEPVSREAMGAFLHRFAGSPAVDGPDASPFVDVAPTHPFFEALAWMADAEISTGTVTADGAYYQPGAAVSREAMAAFMHRMHVEGHTTTGGGA